MASSTWAPISRHLLPWFAVGCAMLLSSCAAPLPAFRQFEGAEAAKLRVRLLYPAEYRPSFTRGLSHVQSQVTHRLVTDASCSDASVMPKLEMFHGRASAAAQAPRGTPGTPLEPVTYPRAGMPGSADPENSESIELTLAPGLHLLGFSPLYTRANWRRTCPAMQTALRLEPNRQYELEIGFEPSDKCFWRSRRLEGSAFVLAPTVQSSTLCGGAAQKP